MRWPTSTASMSSTCEKAPAAPPGCRGAAVAVIRRLGSLLRLGQRVAGLLGGVLAATTTKGAELPEDRADAMYHLYDGGGVTASGPAVLIRKSLFNSVSLSGSYYLDMVSNASIDVVTTA